jgi:hypothetical protein
MSTIPPLKTEFAFELLGGSASGSTAPAPVQIGDTPFGRRRVVPIVGALIEGPLLNGKVLDGGADRQMDRRDGVLDMNATYDIQTHDGVVITVVNRMLRHAAPEVMARLLREEVDPSEYYFRGWPMMEAPVGPYDWVNRTVFISSGIRTPTSVRILFYRVL